jgi:hypothetical protein
MSRSPFLKLIREQMQVYRTARARFKFMFTRSEATFGNGLMHPKTLTGDHVIN